MAYYEDRDQRERLADRAVDIRDAAGPCVGLGEFDAALTQFPALLGDGEVEFAGEIVGIQADCTRSPHCASSAMLVATTGLPSEKYS